MKCQKAYAIMSVGKKDVSAHSEQQKTPELRPLGFFYSVFCKVAYTLGWLPLILIVQPFTNIVGNYTCHDRENKSYKVFRKSTLLSVPV